MSRPPLPAVTPPPERVTTLFGAGAPLYGFALSETGRFLVTFCRDVLAWRDGEDAAARYVAAWSAAANPEALFEQVRDDLPREPLAPDLPDGSRLRRLTTKAEIRAAAARFGNEVDSEVGRAGEGDLAIYAWQDDPPALVELARDDLQGWAAYRVRGPGEEPLSGAVCEEIARELAVIGVGHGPETTFLRTRLGQAEQSGWRYHHLTAFGIDAHEAPGLAQPDPSPLFGAAGSLRRLGEGMTADARALVAACHAVLSDATGGAAHLDGWSRAQTPAALLRRVEDDLTAEPSGVDLPASPRLRLLETKAAIRDAAARLDSLAADFLDGYGGGRAAIFEWLGPPGALVEVDRDQLVGWRLGSARLAGEEPVPPPLAEEISKELRRIGVHVGPGYQELRTALREIQERPDYDYRFWYFFGSEASPYDGD